MLDRLHRQNGTQKGQGQALRLVKRVNMGLKWREYAPLSIPEGSTIGIAIWTV